MDYVCLILQQEWLTLVYTRGDSQPRFNHSHGVVADPTFPCATDSPANLQNYAWQHTLYSG